MKAAVLVEQLFSPVPGGTGRYTEDLLNALESGRSSEDVVLNCSAYHRGLQGESGESLPLGRRALAFLWSRGLGPTVRGADVIHAPTVFAPPRRDTPVVVTVHDAVPWTHPETLSRHGARWHRRIGIRIAHQADAVVVPSKAVAERLLATVPQLRSDRLVVAPNPLPRARFEGLQTHLPDEQARAQRLGLPPGGFLLFVGTREPRKGLDVLLAALKQSGGPCLPLVLVGPSGWGEVDVASSGRVLALGRLDELNLGVVYRSATALVLPSRAEGFGYPIAEAMAARTPVVTSDDPALVETGGGATLTAPIGDAPALAQLLRRVERDANLRAELVERGCARVRDFDSEVYGRRMWDVYEAVAG